MKNGRVRVHLQDASPLTSGSNSVRQTKDRVLRGKPVWSEVKRRRRRPPQRGRGVTPADLVRLNRLRARMPGLNVALRRQAASRAYANRPLQRADRAVNRGLWRLRKKLTPQTLTGKLKLGAGLGAAGLGTAGFLGGLLGGLAGKKKKGQRGGMFGMKMKPGFSWKSAWKKAWGDATGASLY